jgi:hypothetical protein
MYIQELVYVSKEAEAKKSGEDRTELEHTPLSNKRIISMHLCTP